VQRAILVRALLVAAAALALAGGAQAACPRSDAPLVERFDAADAAVVGRVIGVRVAALNGQPERVLTIEVDQHVKGNLPGRIDVWTPRGTECGLDPPRNEAIGLLLTSGEGGRLIASGSSVVAPGPLVAEGGKPKGGVIKVAIGFVILGIVLAWAMWRLKKGKRPDLPGAPTP